jgi:hypothetical protein
VVRRGHVYYFQGTGELEAELQARRNRCRRVDSNVGGHTALDDVQVRTHDDGRGVVFISRLNIHGRDGSMQLYVTDGQMVEIVDVLTKYLELPQRPVEVKLVLEERARARTRKAPAAAREQLDEVALIKRRMMEGR